MDSMDDAIDQERKEYEERLQRRLRILVEESKAGKIRFTEDSKGVIDSLVKVKYAPDGSFDLSTVDGAVRSLALGVTAMHDREELKKAISLSEVQRTYFDILYGNLGHFYEVMVEKGMTPHFLASYLAQQEGAVKELNERLPEFLELINEFWDNAADAVQYHVEDMRDSLRGTFGGDLFPSNEENIVSKCGIYIDTVILPDPFLRSEVLFQNSSPDRKAYFLIKHTLNLLQYRELACADINPPLVVVLPGPADLDAEEKEFAYDLGERDALRHAGKIFGREFESYEALLDFTKPLKDIDDVVKAVVDPSRVLFNVEFGSQIRAQIEGGLNAKDSLLTKDKFTPGQIVALQAIGRLGQANELLLKSRFIGGLPVIDAPTSWQYFVWKLEYDAANVERDSNVTNLHVVRGLQNLAEDKMEWLGKVPPNALIELRKEGAIHEIRNILAKGVSDISGANPLNFQATTDEVFRNIQSAFTEHRKAMYELEQKKWQFAGTTIAQWIAKGTLIGAAAVASPVLLKVGLGVANTLLSPPKPKEIKSANKEFSEEKKALDKLPVGMLFQYAKSEH